MVNDQSADILQRFYEDSFLSFPAEHRARIRALLEDPPMITESGFRNALVRADAEAQLTRAGVPDAGAIFDTLIQRRLITAETRDKVQRLEITHDVLVPMLLRSRKERQDREAKEQAERAALAAEAEQARLAQERRRLRFIIAAVTCLALVAAGFAAYGWWQARMARMAEATANGARHSAVVAAEKEKAANDKNLRTLHEASMADYAVAVQRIEKDNKWQEGVAHLARSLKWQPDNPLAAARLYSTLSLYAAEKQNWPRNLLRHEDSVTSAQFSANGSRIVTASDDNTARVWDAATGKPIGEPLRHEGGVTSAQFSPDGSRIVTASSDNTARVWDAASGKAIGEPLRHESTVTSAQFSPDGSCIVTASWDHTARVWDAASGKAIGGPLRHESSVTSAQFSPDGACIVTASLDSTARVWDAASGKAIGEPLRHEASVTSAQFSPDGTRIVTASWDNTARVWDAASGKAIGEPLHHESFVTSAQFSPDGARIVTASYDKTARVWDAASGKALGEPLRHESIVTSAQFSPDGSRIVTASGDNTARVWDAPMLARLPVPVPEWMLQTARCIAGLTFDDDGQLTLIPGELRIATLMEPPSGNDSWAKLARWLVMPAQERTLTPDSRFTCLQIAERERDSGTKEGIESAIRYDPNVPLAHLLVAKFEKDPARAAFLRDYGLKRLPDDALLWSRASQSLLEQSQTAAALDAARKAVALNPSLTDAHRVLARAFTASGNPAEAMTAWEETLDNKDATFDDFCAAGGLAASQNLGDKTRAIFREGEQRFPAIPEILWSKARAMLLLHAPAEALAALQAYEPKLAAFDGSKPAPDAVAMLAVSRWMTGDKDGAVADYQRVIAQVSSYASVDAVTKSDYDDAIKRPMLEVLAETLKRHPELAPKPEKK